MKASASPYRQITAISTGFPSLDKITGVNGIPLRRIIEISGSWSVGKSTLALSIIAQAQKEGIDCLWADAENSFDHEYAAKLGVELTQLDLLEALPFAEAYLDSIEEWVREHKKGLVVLDAVGALTPREEAEKGSEGRTIGGQAKIIAVFCRKVIPLMVINNVALIILNHEFLDIMNHGKLMTSGGAKLAYAKSMWLRLRKMPKRVMQGEQQVGDVIEIEVKKNKLASTAHQTCEMTMIYGEGFSREQDLLQELLDSGEITKKGNTYYRGDERLGVGLKNAREALKV